MDYSLETGDFIYQSIVFIKFGVTLWENFCKQTEIFHKIFSTYFDKYSKIAFETSYLIAYTKTI